MKVSTCFLPCRTRRRLRLKQAHHFHRIYPRLVHRYAPMQMRARHTPGRAYFSQQRARFNFISRSHVNCR
jgi:hypothetical protein